MRKPEQGVSFGPLVGTTAGMKRVFALIQKAAKMEVPVLIVGETGTGKDLVAEEIHRRSGRNANPYVAVNMGALPPDLVTSELFGHLKGAFTGASDVKAGRFQEARGGTLFLDEITTMREAVQVALLRVLETGKFRRLGAKRDTPADVRLISATNMDPQEAIRKIGFREDLLHRLQVLRIDIPPLQRRKSDIKRLAEHFLRLFRREFDSRVDGIADEAIQLLKTYHWPGNLRELKNVIAQGAILAEHGKIQAEHLPSRITRPVEPDAAGHGLAPSAPGQMADGVFSDTRDGFPSSQGISFPLVDGVFAPVGFSLDEVEKAYVLKTLAACGNNKTRAARILRISRKALYDKMERWGLLN